jgi:hypothetical protein
VAVEGGCGMDQLLENSQGKFGAATLVPLCVAVSMQLVRRDAAEQHVGRRWARFQWGNDIHETAAILL